MPKSEPMLSVAEVCELQPCTEQNATWINPGFQGVVRSITTKTKKAGGNFWPCILADTTGSATIEVSFFQAPKFKEGDLIELSGQGLRRTEYQGKAQAALGKGTEVHVLGASVHAPEQAARAASGAPSVNGTPQPVNGQTVGMAMKLATDLLVEGGDSIAVDTQAYWQRVHAIASHIIRVSRALEAGKLTPAPWAKPEPAPAPPPVRQPAPKPKPGPDGSAFPRDMPHDDALDEDVPF